MVFLAVVPIQCLLAQESDPFEQADAALTASYKQALARYPQRDNEEPLRKAERAWIEFSNKNEAVFDALKKENLMSEDAHDAAELAEVNARTHSLQILFYNNGIPLLDPQASLARQEARLTDAYLTCLRQLSGEDHELLRKAERAWIAYRDLNTDAVALALHQPNDPLSWTASAKAWLASDRADELSSLTAATKQAAPSLPAATVTQSGSFDDRADVASWQTDTKTLLNDLMEKKDAPFFRAVTGLKNPPPLPGDAEPKIISAWNTMVTLRNKEITEAHSITSEALYSSSDEAAAISVLQAWIAFEALLKAGNLHGADFTLSNRLQQKPNPVPQQYAAIWEKLAEWNTLADQTEAQIQDHVRKAKVSADLGKSADAISELQAAYSLFNDPGIAAEIKKIRDASLGL
jgi:uncharacterized protein YecT (DUF1311 family)